jgi:hypothetical protein
MARYAFQHFLLLCKQRNQNSQLDRWSTVHESKRENKYNVLIICALNIIRGYYKRSKQFKHVIKPKLFKISTLTTHGFVEKLWKLYHCSPFSNRMEHLPIGTGKLEIIPIQICRNAGLGAQQATCHSHVGTTKSRSNTL